MTLTFELDLYITLAGQISTSKVTSSKS